jgi:hypothetical protein
VREIQGDRALRGPGDDRNAADLYGGRRALEENGER